jgi:hypothetical protein
MIMTRTGWLLCVLLACLLPTAAHALSRQAMHTAEASLLVTGHVDIATDGTVAGFALDDVDKLPPSVASMLSAAVPGFEFEPVLVDGVATAARARMSARVVARPLDDGALEVRLRSIDFGAPDEGVRSVSMAPPSYPREVIRVNGSGIVYLLLRIGGDGRVRDVAVEQVNLTTSAGARTADEIRRRLGDAAAAAARTWEWAAEPGYTLPEEWVRRVPVDFVLNAPEPAYGKWQAYFRGPYTPAPWAAPMPASFSPDAIAAGRGGQPGTSPFRLLTPIDG